MAARKVLWLLTLIATTPALASGGFIEGTYLESAELCAQAREDSLQSVLEAGNIVLSESGLEGIEYNCEFVQITKATNAPAWAVIAVCSEPGHVFPDVLTVTQLNASEVELVSVRSASEEENPGNSGTYVLCDGVTAP